MRPLFVCSLALVALAGVATAFTDLEVNSPQDLRDEFTEGMLDDRPAMFGIPSYESSIQGPVVYASPPDACSKLDTSKWDGNVPVRIVMVSRGSCSFVEKVRNAEAAGAKAVIVVDNTNEIYLPYMADDGTGGDIVTPSVLIHQEDGAKINNTLNDGQEVVVELSWTLPKEEHVQFRLYHVADANSQTRTFFEQFGAINAKLGDSATFIPDFIIRNKWWGLSGADCVNENYCAYDPKGDANVPPNGRDVVMASLYSKCLYHTLTADRRANKWWDFTVKYNEMCVPAKLHELNCREEALAAAGLAGYKKNDDVAACMAFDGTDNAVLRNETEREWIDSVGFITPSLYINNARYTGSLNCKEPVTLATCGPLEAICAAYIDGAEPAICRGSSNSSSGGGGVSAGLVVFIVILAVGAVGVAGYVYIRKQRQDMRIDLDNILSSYMNIDDANAMRSSEQPMIDGPTSDDV